MNNLIIVYITNPTEEKARQLALHLLHKKLLACVNIMQCKTMYCFDERIKDEAEAILIGKTLPELYEKVQQEVRLVHPYKIPCMIKIDAQVNQDYLHFVSDIVKKAS